MTAPKRVKQEEVLSAYPDHKDGKLILPDGVITHWRNRKLHNEDGPAVIYPNGYGFEYYRKGLLHRDNDIPIGPENLPAVKLDSRSEWHWWGKLHRVDGPAIHDTDLNIQVYAQHGKKHRGDGPAVIHEPEGYFGFWEMGERNRIDGPARIWVLHNKAEWWLKGKRLTESEMKEAEDCFRKGNDRWPLLFNHPVLRPIAEHIKFGGTLSRELLSFKTRTKAESDVEDMLSGI